jgi:signal transduction histidine kinase
MDEIVWAVNPSNDDLENVANYIIDFAQGYLSDAGLRCRVRIPRDLPPYALTAQFRHDLFLTCKETFNNIVKHAHASDVTIEVQVSGNQLTITITDNGVGLEQKAEERSRRNGMKNMRSRMAAIGGDMQVSSAVGGGTTITLTAPLVSPASPS